jgi:hypothetical protein
MQMLRKKSLVDSVKSKGIESATERNWPPSILLRSTTMTHNLVEHRS